MAGEHGVMGDEEDRLIRPAIAQWRAQHDGHASIEGPFSSDTLFSRFRDASPFDAVVCMYHDQGLIPLKLLHFSESANLTLGLPIVRTSVDHGTAYDIAGRGIADPRLDALRPHTRHRYRASPAYSLRSTRGYGCPLMSHDVGL